MDALSRLTQALHSGATGNLAALALDAAACCEAATAAMMAADAHVGGAQAAAQLTSYCAAATELFKLLGKAPEGSSALAACAPRLLPAVEALARTAFGDATWQAAVSDEAWRAACSSTAAVAHALLEAARAHGATCAAAPDCVRMQQRLVEDAASAHALGARFSVPLVASLCEALSEAAGGAGDAPPALAACAGEACAALARCGADASRRVAAGASGELLLRDAKLSAFFLLKALKLAAKANAGAPAWPRLLEAGMAARRAQAAVAARGDDDAVAHAAGAAVARADACLYRTLEAAELDVAALERLLDALCVASDGLGDLSVQEALADAAARCAMVCDALLLRAPQHAPRLRAAAAGRMRWALRTACCDCTSAALALPPAAALRPRLLAALGACLSACAAGAAEPGGAPAAAAAEAFLFDAAADAHPLLRSTALDAWAALAAASPPAMTARHAQQLLALMAACLAAAPPGAGLDAVRCAAPRGCPASASPDPRALAAARLAAAAARLLEACPDGGALAAAAYAQLLAGPTCDPFGQPPAAAALLCAGFPLARLGGAWAQHAAQQLPRAAVAQAQAALEAVAPNSGAAELDASPAAHRLYRCLACLTALCSLYVGDGDLAADVAGLCLDAAMRLGTPAAARRAVDDATAPLRCARAEALHLAAALAGRLDASATAALARKLTAVADPADGLPDAAPALAELLAQLHSGGVAQPCAQGVLCTAFMQRHWALVHASADGFVRLCRRPTPAGATPPREMLPNMSAAGDHVALKKLLSATAGRVSAGARAAAPTRLDAAAEADALEADANVLYLACCAA